MNCTVILIHNYSLSTLSLLKSPVMMDEADMQSPPQKKQKVSHLTMDGTFDDAMDATVASTDQPISDLPDNQQEVSHVEPPVHLPANQLDASHEQLRKEAECGITEFVSPELPGFTGILKKRYDSSDDVSSMDVDISIKQVHRFPSQ